jgi:hypothetical protein
VLLPGACLSIRPHETARPDWADIREIGHAGIFQKSIEKIQGFITIYQA